MRLAGRITQREVGEQEARHGSVLDYILGASHHHGGNAACFEVAGNESGSLVANRAVRYQHRDIDRISEAAGKDFRGIDIDRNAMAAIGRRAEEARRDLADPTPGRRLQELWQRKPRAAVGRTGVLAVIADMRDAPIVRLSGVAVIDLIELGTIIIRTSPGLVALRRVVKRGGGEWSDPRLCH